MHRIKSSKGAARAEVCRIGQYHGEGNINYFILCTGTNINIERVREDGIESSHYLKHASHWHPPHLIHRPKRPHILSSQLFHLIIQMLPQYLSKPIHHYF